MFENLKLKRNGNNLSPLELQKATAFFMALMEGQAKRKIKIVFRGETYESLNEKLNFYRDKIDYNQLGDFLFLIGEKGRGYRKAYRDKVTRKSKLFGVRDIQPPVFNYIFTKYSRLLKRSDKPEIRRFCSENSSIAEFFLTAKNRKLFIDEISKFSDSKKLKIRDYYLTPLHHAGEAGYYNNSIYLSTTTDFNTASFFSSYRPNRERVIIIGWVEPDLSNWAVAFNFAASNDRLMTNSQLPIYSRSFFPKQNEISFKGGLFPHYILGYIRLDVGELELNPHFFTTAKRYDDILKNGFDIDQSSFHTKLKETDYEAFFWKDDKGNYGDTVYLK